MTIQGRLSRISGSPSLEGATGVDRSRNHPTERMERNVANGIAVEAPVNGSLKGASINRLACLVSTLDMG